jgi:hypothetical protein
MADGERIKKTMIVITFLHRDDYPIAATPIEDLLNDADTGPIIAGSATILSTDTVPPDQVEAELLAIGNDGSFFEDPDDTF